MQILSAGNYFGNKSFELKYNGLILSEYNYHDPYTSWHYHENPYFMYVLDGDLTDINKKEKSNIPPGSLVFHNWQEVHMNEKLSTLGRGFHLELDRKWFEERKLDIDLWEGSKVLKDPILHHLLVKIYYEFKTQDEYSKMTIELLLLQLCELITSSFNPPQKQSPIWLKNLKELLDQTEEHLSLSYLSEQLGLHPVHISRSLPTYLGCSLGDYMRRQKVKKAFNYLTNDKYSLTQIAYTCGFSDQSHFTKTFKSYLGKTPKIFRAGLMKTSF